MLKTAPAVFVVGQEYQIMVQVKKESLVWVKIGNDTYFDETNGIMNSLSPLHRISVPMERLDRVKEYTVCVKQVKRRKPYFTETKETVEQTFRFRPVPKEDIRIYHISDTHNLIHEPIRAAQAFGRMDALVLNGDVIDHSGSPRKFENIYKICDVLTHGEIPVVFSRGNHDMRGRFAEKFAEYTPNQYGNTYYSFRLGTLWGVVLDCGEDKADSCEEYGFTVACHPFRERQTLFLNRLVANAENEYVAEDVKRRLVIVHNPFSQKDGAPFDIEEELYREWCAILREEIKPDLMICGHTHSAEIREIGNERDTYGQPCPVITAALYDDKKYWAGYGFVLKEEKVEVILTDCKGEVLSEEEIPYGRVSWNRTKML